MAGGVDPHFEQLGDLRYRRRFGPSFTRRVTPDRWPSAGVPLGDHRSRTPRRSSTSAAILMILGAALIATFLSPIPLAPPASATEPELPPLCLTQRLGEISQQCRVPLGAKVTFTITSGSGGNGGSAGGGVGGFGGPQGIGASITATWENTIADLVRLRGTLGINGAPGVPGGTGEDGAAGGNGTASLLEYSVDGTTWTLIASPNPGTGGGGGRCISAPAEGGGVDPCGGGLDGTPGTNGAGGTGMADPDALPYIAITALTCGGITPALGEEITLTTPGVHAVCVPAGATLLYQTIIGGGGGGATASGTGIGGKGGSLTRVSNIGPFLTHIVQFRAVVGLGGSAGGPGGRSSIGAYESNVSDASFPSMSGHANGGGAGTGASNGTVGSVESPGSTPTDLVVGLVPGPSGLGGSAGSPGADGSITLRFGPCSVPFDHSFTGTGTSADPYLIQNTTDLQAMSGCTFAGKHLRQTADLVLTEPRAVSNGTPRAGTSEFAAVAFQGTYDGSGHSVTYQLPSSVMLRCDSLGDDEDTTQCVQGMFETTSGATIRNVSIRASGQHLMPRAGWLVGVDNPSGTSGAGSTLSNITVSSGRIQGGAGGILGGNSTGTTISDSSVSGTYRYHPINPQNDWIDNDGGGVVGEWSQDVTVIRSRTAIDAGRRAGAIVGPNSRRVIVRDSYSTGWFGQDSGGILGPWATNATVENSYSTGNIGWNRSTYDINLYFPGDPPGEYRELGAGGIVGPNTSNVTVNNVFTNGFVADGSDGLMGPGATAPTTTAAYASGGTFRFEDFAAVAQGWLGGRWSGATWGRCATVNPVLPYLTAFFSADPCPAPAESGTAASGESTNAQNSVNGASAQGGSPQSPSTNPTSVKPGSSGIFINGTSTDISTDRGGRGSGLTLQAGPVEFTLRSQTANGRRVPLAPDGSLILARTGEVPISGDGLAPNSSVAVTLFSNPISLGSTPVGADGTFKTAPVIPASVPLGAHTLQLTGRTKTGDPFVLSIGVLVETPAAALGADPVISVRPAIITPGTSVAVTARGVQAGCRVTFTIAGKRAATKASKTGVAQAQITMPNRLPRTAVVRGTVSGPKCTSVSVSSRVQTRSRS